VYRIREKTKAEFVAVGSNGDVVRWGETKGPEQEWVIVPLGDNRYAFLTNMPDFRERNERMAVGSNGKIVRWGATGGAEQVFSFSSPKDGWVEIFEHTKNENVAVGSDGKLLRWGSTGNNDQLFKLEVQKRGTPPTLSTDQRYEPGRIPGFPKLTSFEPPPPTQSYLISETLYPSFFVKDARYRSKAVQVYEHPYYRLRREQRWELTFYKKYDGHSDEEDTVRMMVGMSTETSKSMESTIGATFNTDFGMAFAPELEVKGLKISGNKVEGSMSNQLTTTLKVQRSKVTTRISEREHIVKVTVPHGKAFARAIFVLVDTYKVIDRNGDEVGRWEVRNHETIVQASFPEL
jgi:hypothetical protein